LHSESKQQIWSEMQAPWHWRIPALSVNWHWPLALSQAPGLSKQAVSVGVHTTGVPAQTPPAHRSLVVQRLPSSQACPRQAESAQSVWPLQSLSTPSTQEVSVGSHGRHSPWAQRVLMGQVAPIQAESTQVPAWHAWLAGQGVAPQVV